MGSTGPAPEGKLLHTLAINLTGPPDSVTAEINQFADWIANQANRLNIRSKSSRPLAL